MKRRKEDIGYIPQPLMTSQTKLRLERELEEARENVIDAERTIGEVGGTDDWHENFALEQAYIKYDETMKKALRLNALLSNVEIIKPRQEVERIEIGNTVMVQYEEESPERFTVLGEADVGTQPGWISSASPLGSNLIGKKNGDIFELESGGVIHRIQVLDILPGDF